MYTFSAYNASAGNDTIRNTTIPNTTIPNTTITTLSSSASQNTVVFGQPVTFTATITGDNSTPPTGEVEFNEGATKVGSGTLANGMDQATYTLTAAQTAALSVGSHSFSATYNGDSADLASSTTEELMLMVTQATPTLTLGNLAQTYSGAPESATVTTSPAGLSGVSVTYNGSTTPPTNAGSYAVVASLSNANYTASNATGTLVISPATPAFSNLTPPQTIGFGTPSVTLGGTLAAGLLARHRQCHRHAQRRSADRDP